MKILTDDKTKREREAACATCPLLSDDKKRCNDCGCHIFVKVRWLHNKCPKGKW